MFKELYLLFKELNDNKDLIIEQQEKQQQEQEQELDYYY